MKNNREELMKIMESNPNLPFVFLVNNDDICSDYGSTVMENFHPYVAEIYEYERFGEHMFSDDEDEVVEYFIDEFCDEEEYKNLPNEEFYEKVKEYVNEELVHYKAIIVSVYA